mmetsp:Transcript_89699/g.155217  ORF Transcript_89699/g.155217 Transcript_89699/m.155217 type:complete len:507 (-) Transcript_89699:515-2035(-)
MGCGASAASQKKVNELLEAQLALVPSNAELTEKLKSQTDLLANLVKGQHQIAHQISSLADRLPKSDVDVGQKLQPRRSSADRSSLRLGAVAAPAEISADSVGALRLEPAIQNYAWGRPWQTSLVAQLCETKDRPLDRMKSYAEMWMGTHPNGPASVKLESSDGVGGITASLKSVISGNPEYWLGRDAWRFKNDLPFLLKVLSVNQALSIQAHPHRKLAEYLHDTYPDRYKDANHKPEICLPLGAFEALVAFRPFAEIQRYIEDMEELQQLCGFGMALSLKDLYGRLMRSNAAKVAEQAKKLVQRLEQKPKEKRSPEEALVLRLQKDYPGDVGIFSVFFLNYVQIAEDEAHCFIFCAPDEPHAYLYGDCVECMSLSDNVVRAGLTPKFKDVETLLNMMTYRDDRLPSLVNKGEQVSPGVVKYDPPVEDFLVYEVEGLSRPGEGAQAPLELPHASICICTSGSFSIDFQTASSQVEEVRRGQSFFVRAGSLLHILRAEQGSKLFVATY